jgi:hypothetical protein
VATAHENQNNVINDGDIDQELNGKPIIKLTSQKLINMAQEKFYLSARSYLTY